MIRGKFRRLLLILAIGASLLVPLATANADIGPAPPSLYFKLIYQIPSVPITESQLLLCEDPQCKLSKSFGIPPVSNGAPQIFECRTDYCLTVLGITTPSPYFRLAIEFADKTRDSNVFKKVAYSAEYNVTIQENELAVEEVFSWGRLFGPLQIYLFVPALLLTLITETGIAAIYSKRAKVPVKWVGYANMISLLVVWFVFPFLTAAFGWIFFAGEIFAVLFEALFLFLTNRKTGLSFRRAGIVSLLTNLSSVAVGVIMVLALIAVFAIPYWLRYGL